MNDLGVDLFLVPTPVGNLGDMTFRAIEVLQSVDLILAEDTRTSGKLLKHFEIKTPMKSYHLHNEKTASSYIIGLIKEGKKLALISDAGTPALSDPGFLLVREVHEQGFKVSALPGATALIPALVSSGLPTDRFVFEGFLPPKKGRMTKIEALKTETRTTVFYESPHKLLKLLTQIQEVFGDEKVVAVAREISKLYEEVVKLPVGEMIAKFEESKPKGEFVVMVQGIPRKNFK